MTDFFHAFKYPWILSLIGFGALFFTWLLYRLYQAKADTLESAIMEISFDKVEGLVIPSIDEGEILIDYLLLTSQGLLIIEVKDVKGNVFGGDKVQDWTVISDDRRYTFSNPQPALYDRILAVQQIVRQVPVVGRILFLDGAQFTKDVPDLVTDLVGLVTDFNELDKSAAKLKIRAFRPYWDLICEEALSNNSK
ncbi:MAG: nuclease-related domain-containing protein [Woeseiaceae bacterium]|nr:nuclease-related domain-containing protein [Woeseiaceae bacterium]